MGASSSRFQGILQDIHCIASGEGTCKAADNILFEKVIDLHGEHIPQLRYSTKSQEAGESPLGNFNASLRRRTISEQMQGKE